MGSKSNFDRLHEAGVIAGEHFSDNDKQLIDKMSDEEVDTLVKLRHKMGEAPAGKEHLRPNIGI